MPLSALKYRFPDSDRKYGDGEPVLRCGVGVGDLGMVQALVTGCTRVALNLSISVRTALFLGDSGNLV